MLYISSQQQSITIRALKYKQAVLNIPNISFNRNLYEQSFG